MSWSRILDEYPQAVFQVTSSMFNTKNDYHNMEHVRAIYAFFEQQEVPYYKELDWAVLFHDFVYDALPEKEARSRDAFLHFVKSKEIPLDDEEIATVCDLIMVTVDHVAHPSDRLANWMVLGDLESLMYVRKWYATAGRLCEEMKRLYGIDDHAFLVNNRTFLVGLHQRISFNVDENFELFTDHQQNLYERLLDALERITDIQHEIILGVDTDDEEV